MKIIRYVASSAGISRRKAMELLKDGKIYLNGSAALDASTDVSPGKDIITINGKKLAPPNHIYLVMYKPRKTICSRYDPQGRQTILDLLEHRHKKANSVGRLDYNTTGVLLLTTDGELAQRLMRSKVIERKYMVKLWGNVSDESFDRWRRGITIDGRKTREAKVEIIERKGAVAKVNVTLTEGRYRIIHKLAEKTGMRVLKIHRFSFGGIRLKGLKPGMYRYLLPSELRHLQSLTKISPQI